MSCVLEVYKKFFHCEVSSDVCTYISSLFTMKHNAKNLKLLMELCLYFYHNVCT
jgi:hypothetical protein